MCWLATFPDPERLSDLATDPLYLPRGTNIAGRPRQFRRVDLPAASAAHTALHAALSARGSRFAAVACSACGESFGPGDGGFSRCAEHAGFEAMDDTAAWAHAHGAEVGRHL